MSLHWVYDIPNWLLCLITVGVFVVGSVVSLYVSRGFVRRYLGPPPGQNDVVSYYLGAFGVFYGLTIGLIAVATWQNFADLDRLVAEEASALRVLDMNVYWYPSPEREELHQDLRAYVDYVIDREWPAQRQRVSLDDGSRLLASFGRTLADFEPDTAGQAAIHEATLEAYDQYIEVRRERQHGVSIGLPAVVWFVLLAGAVLSIALTLLFSLPDAVGHVLLTVILSSFVGLLIFLIVAMDHPFWGEFSVSAEAFERIRQQMAIEARTLR